MLRLLITYWVRRVFMLKVFMLLKTNLTQQDTKNFSITNRLGRLIFLIIQKRLEHPSHIYRISHLLPLNPPSIVVPTSITSSNDTNSSVISGFSSEWNISSESNSRSFLNGSLIFGIDGNSQKLITSNNTCLTIVIADLIISEGLFPKNKYSRNYWSCKGTFPRHIFLPTEISHPKNYLLLFMNRTWK